ncbi:MAG: C40 family peptidase [Gaiellaceae bacterium]
MALTNPTKPARPPKQQRPPKKSPLAAAAAPRTAAQAAQAELDPVIASITKSANERAAAAEAAIKGLTDSYAHSIGGIDYGAPYAGAESGQAAVDAALEQSLAGHGSDLAAGLATRLAPLEGTSGAPVVSDIGHGLAVQGAGAGTTRLASGSAALGNLIADAAASREYGTKMPGIADLSGLQGLKQAEGNAQSEIAQGTTAVESKLPDIIQQIKADRLAARNAKTEAAYKGAELALARDKAAAQVAQGNARLGIEQQNANTSSARLQIEAQRAAQTAVNEDRNYGLALSRLGIAQKDAQVRWLSEQAKLNNGGYTPNELRNLQLQANQIAGDAAKHHGPNGKGMPGLQEVMHTMVVNDIPPTVALRAAKLAGYQPGKAGMFSGFAKGLARPFGAAAGAAETTAAKTIVRLASQYQGTPYVWGGESPKGFDCSGFAQFLYGKAGISIPRTTYTQWQGGHNVPQGQLEPGDLVFFKGSDSVGGLPGHVGIYIGGGKMIDAPHTGASVRTEDVASFGGYMGARRYSR